MLFLLRADADALRGRVFCDERPESYTWFEQNEFYFVTKAQDLPAQQTGILGSTWLTYAKASTCLMEISVSETTENKDDDDH